jgi:hypothetical protein
MTRARQGLWGTFLLASPALLAAGAVWAAPPAAAPPPVSYTIQPIVKLGDMVADLTIKAKGDLENPALNDSGQIVFVTENAAGGEMLIQYADGQFIPIVVGGRDAPGGTWVKGSNLSSYLGINQHGNVAFSANATLGGKTSYGTFRWDYQARKVTAVALKGMMAVNGLTFVDGSSDGPPTINNSDEIAFPANVKNAAGGTHSGVFFLGRDGQLQAVALPDQVLPGGAKIVDAAGADLNDAGTVAFDTYRPNSPADGAYLWEKSAITPVAVAQQDIPGAGKIANIARAWVNNQNHTVLVLAALQGNASNSGLYRFTNGALTPLILPGQDMPDGGKLLGVEWASRANDAGQHAFIGLLQDKTWSAYLLDADGKVSLVLKTGATTALGKITIDNTFSTAVGISLNHKGQVALNATFDGGPPTMVVLTPTAP